MMPGDRKMYDPTQKLLIASQLDTANSYQALQMHPMALGYFVFPEITGEGEEATTRYTFFKILLKKLKYSSVQEFS